MGDGHRDVAARKREERDTKAARRDHAQAEVLKLATAVANGELSGIEALPRAEALAVVVRMALADTDDLHAFETWLKTLQQQVEEERARAARAEGVA